MKNGSMNSIKFPLKEQEAHQPKQVNLEHYLQIQPLASGCWHQVEELQA